ncbi:MAG TPA: DUF3817 domain-containing protein [Cytophagaceae bacterium]
MKNSENLPLARFRTIAFWEGISAIVLFFIAMPIKYLLDYPLVVKYVGWAHGILFVLYILSLAQVTFTNKWSLYRVGLAFLASLVPFGTFVFDKKVLKEETANSVEIDN